MPRVGMAQDLAAAGTELPAPMTAGRWASPAMSARYTAGEDPWPSTTATAGGRKEGQARPGARPRKNQLREERYDRNRTDTPRPSLG